MMPPNSESPDTQSPKPQKDYRAARRAFIAACEAAGVDTVARLHPHPGPDGKPLFMDCAALGPRRAPKAMLVVAEDAAGSAIQIELLRGEIAPPPDAKLVLVHALDPAAFAGVAGDSAWPPAMLGAVATEDLPKVRDLTVLALGGRGESLEPVLRARLPEAKVKIVPPACDITQARNAIAAFFAPQ
jgi:Protein of unknown function (DUF2817)